MQQENPFHTEVSALRNTFAALRSRPPRPVTYLGGRSEEILRQMPLFPDQCVYVLNLTDGRVLHARGFREVLGYADEEVSLESLVHALHPEDAPVVTKIKRTVLEAISNLGRVLEPFEICLTLDYRIRAHQGHHIRFLQQAAVLESDEGTGLPICTYSLCKDISSFKTSNSIGWQVKGPSAHLLDLGDLQELSPRSLYKPSMREMAVIRKLAEGKSSKVIADELHLSEHTVAAHRRNLLQRTGLKNTAELVRHVMQAGWL